MRHRPHWVGGCLQRAILRNPELEWDQPVSHMHMHEQFSHSTQPPMLMQPHILIPEKVNADCQRKAFSLAHTYLFSQLALTEHLLYGRRRSRCWGPSSDNELFSS